MARSFRKTCGGFTLEVSEPHPSWVTIHWEGGRLVQEDGRRPLVRIEELHDLRYLIARALVEMEQSKT